MRLERLPVRHHPRKPAAVVGFLLLRLVVADFAVIVPADFVHADAPHAPALREQLSNCAFAGVHGADEDQGELHGSISLWTPAWRSEDLEALDTLLLTTPRLHSKQHQHAQERRKKDDGREQHPILRIYFADQPQTKDHPHRG